MKSRLTALLILSTATAFGCGPNVDLGDLPGETDGGSGSGEGTTESATTTASTVTAASDDSSNDTTATSPEGDVDGIDVLFVLDNSGSMGTAQRQLQDSAEAVATALDATGLDYRIGVTTTDNGNYWCRGSGVSDAENGELVPPSSCRQREGDFYFTGDDTDSFDQACAQRCLLEQLELTDGAPPWLSADTLGNTSMVDALACSLPMGINGCGFEQPLESMYLAVNLSQTNGNDQTGFIRPTAHLVVIFVTDEADCSLNPVHELTVVGEEFVGNQVFWSLPDQQQSPTSAVCWNAGVQCSGSGTPAYDSCAAQDKNVEGGVAASAQEAVIHPLSRYTARLDALRATKVAGAGVYTFGIVGVPPFYSSPADVSYSAGPNGTNPDSFQAMFGIGPGCIQGDIEAVPPVRMLEFTGSGDQGGVPLYSICGGELSGGFAEHFEDIFAQVGG